MNPHVVVPQKQGDVGKNVLFVSELPDTITEQDLDTFFSDFKEFILMIQINRMQNNRGVESFNAKPTSATIIFKEHKKADEARRALNMTKLRGKTIRIMWHERDNSVRYNNQGNLFIKNIPLDVKPRQFYELFLQYGDIISAKLCEDEEGNHNGYGYVSYYENESADKAILNTNNKIPFPNSSVNLEVARFQKKNERFNNLNKLSTNKNLYVKNLPNNYDENSVKSLFGKYGTITWSKVLVDSNQRKFAIISMDTEDAANKARDALNNFQVDENILFVDTLQKKSDRQRILSSKITENNSILNTQFKNCNLYIKNLPEKCTEKQFHEEFEKFGEIKSLKIPKYILVTKVGNNLKEECVSKGFGYVCFTDQESAKNAKEQMSGKLLSSFPDSKRPLLIEFFMPKFERKNILMKYQQNFNPLTRQPNPMMGNFQLPPQMYNANYNLPHPGMSKNVKHPMHPNVSLYENKGRGPKPIPVANPQPVSENTQKEDQPDINYLNTMDDESAKKEYLGEFIFKKISNHALNQTKNLTIDLIGKITGMILGIDDLNEIIDICRDNDNLTGRIVEALNLLNI